MISKERAFQLIRDSLDSLERSGVIEEHIQLQGDTVLLGIDSLLDSIGLVTFITDLEDRLSTEINEEIFLVLDEIHEFNVDKLHLLAGTLAQYIAQMPEIQKIDSHG